MRRLLKILGWLLAVVVLAVVALVLVVRHSPPTGGVAGPAADELAHSIERAVSAAAWARTGAVRFTFSAAGHTFEHLWDKTRGLDRVRWAKHEVLVDLAHKTGRALVDGQPVDGDAGRALVENAYKRWVNDSFWLNPLAKLFDEGVTRELVQVDGQPALWVKYASGGVTPGDSYLWLLGDDGKPVAWRLWVSVLKVGGMQISWQGWTTLGTGAEIATEHRLLGLKSAAITDVAATASLAQLQPGAPDPFASLASAK